MHPAKTLVEAHFERRIPAAAKQFAEKHEF